MLTDSEFNRIVTYVKKFCGIDLSKKRVLVKGRLESYILRNGYGSFDEYMNKVEHEGKGSGEAEKLINVLTTNHTYFMRESIHFEYMTKVVLPYLQRKEAARKDLRIWSGASSTGEEPYTIAMNLMEYFGLQKSSWDTRVLATDISTQVLEHAVRGVYLKEDVAPLPEKWKRRFFRSISADECMVTDELKAQLFFRKFNLMDPLPFRKKFHIVFLRNVMIYFEDDVKYRLVSKIYDHMEPGGYFFIGTTESLDKEKTQFQYVQPSIYRKRE
ncbi:MAG: protein-glutamate O-methyltransferase CheR [Muribaculaceae bacterium]|nr:protein-glutamate O-methyltransferase CheR [Roseburia sp.]MCM1430357.1 protein-glutamate O-methyltransferase CheR [Muribaculaceae bacterium]MCM1492447.1 protein-glutamate O-methyltransferase CheR [Muribaculaceae bacterium]